MRNVEITLREILVSIIIVLVMIGLGFFIAEKIHDSVSSNNEKYFKALKVNNNPDLFDYSIRTEVGDMLSYGVFRGNHPVSDKLVKGKYFAIQKIEEHYTMHTRTVSYKCGKSTCTRTEIYWTWDTVGTDYYNVSAFNFLGRNFKYNKVTFNNYEYIDTVHTGFHVRFKIYAIPKEFNGTLYSMTKNKTINDTELYINQHIKEVVNDKEHSADNWVIWFWVAWVILTLGLVTIFVVLENNYINGNKNIRRSL